MITVKCLQCGLCILVPPAVQGRRGVCFGCGAPLAIPLPNQPAQNPSLDFRKGQRVSDRYEIVESLGKGGMGVVYHAYDHLIREPVALKFMKPQLLQTQRGQQLFIREAQIARRLRHENIVAVHDVTTTPEGILYLSMEYVRGKSLRAFLRPHRTRGKYLDVRRAVAFAAQILDALEYAHRSVVHRDVKPENVMLIPGEKVKVLDFGLAKILDEEAVELFSDESKEGRVIGTMGYAAPEQQRHQDVDSRADIYAMGLVLHELFTLRCPVDPHVKVEDVRDDIAPALIAVLQKALRSNRENRWQSAGEFRSALLRAFKDSYRAVSVAASPQDESAEASTEGMVLMEGGSFLMGNNEVRNQAPEFEAHVRPFFIDKHPVTVQQYTEFLQATGHAPPPFWGRDDLAGLEQPVVGVTWHDANAYATWAGKRLPTEAQWEFAARGKQNRTYPWGDAEPDPRRANYGDNVSMPSIVDMHEDGQTPEGLLDIAGNVHEWTADPFVPYARNGQPSQEPRRTVRGGAWDSEPGELRCSFRKGVFPDAQLPTVGFRCVVPARTAMQTTEDGEGT